MSEHGRVRPVFYDEALSLALKAVGLRNMNPRAAIVSPIFRLKLRGPVRGVSVSSGVARRQRELAAGDTPAVFEPAPFEPGVPGGMIGAAGAVVVDVRAISFHLADDPVGGAGSTQVRVFGPIARPFRVSQVALYAVGGVQVGQFLNVLVSADGDRTNVTTPTGSSIFADAQLPAGIGALDAQSGLQVPERPLSLSLPATVEEEGRFLKVHAFFVVPATVLPDVHVVVTVEEVEAPAAAA